MKNEMTPFTADLATAREEIARLSALSDAELIRWARSDNTGYPLPEMPCTPKARDRLIRRIRLTNRLVWGDDGRCFWVDC